MVFSFYSNQQDDDVEDTRDLYDSDSDSSPFARARVSGSTPGTPLFLPQLANGEASFIPPIPGSSPIRGGHIPGSPHRGSPHRGSPHRGSPNRGSYGSTRSTGGLAGLGPRDLLASVSSSYGEYNSR